MQRAYHKWTSAALGRDMELLVFGKSGARLLAFPTSKGRFFDWEDRGLVAALGDRIDKGDLQVICVDSVDAESWYADQKHPADRVKRHMQYDAYLLNEVVPFTLQQNATPFLIVAGASFGGYHAVTFGLRYPEQVGRILSMSGLCNIRRFTDGYFDENIYFNNPVDFIAQEHDPKRLEALRKVDIILCTGRDDPLCPSNQQLSGVLWERGIGNALRIWDGWAHDWPFWEKMLKLYLSGHD